MIGIQCNVCGCWYAADPREPVFLLAGTVCGNQAWDLHEDPKWDRPPRPGILVYDSEESMKKFLKILLDALDGEPIED